jgi:dipeptide/tripeptide permease
LNSVLIVGAQLPVAKAVEGRRRVRALALMCLVAAAGWLLVELAGIAAAAAAVPLLVLAIVFVSAGECLYDSIYGPLVADLARPRARRAVTWLRAGLPGSSASSPCRLPPAVF